MLIERPGDPAKKYIDPAQFEYRFKCENCGCIFTESGAECKLIPIFDYTHDVVSEIMVIHRCPNCRENVNGEKT